ncbi:hypothetical protein BjapCC829_22025 [Bradyrhizobium barranii]|uniref:TIGR04255 family protein n=1 Tax=Bradyrhizobium barranii TaxID=2992140 RepID=A0ABY3QYI8_9BRAD|nr:hypothetical protein [Bradyrhizobium japonicum]UFW91069.1 hypothetical protein BjapCC829_22025 [Bradyrhizobium japonicum]
MTSWCDKLASVPTVGLALDFHFAGSDTILTALTHVWDPLVEGQKARFELEKLEAFTVTINTHDGFKYSVEPSKASVSFNHRMRPKAVSGGAPVMEMLSQPLPFTELLPIVNKKLVEAALALPGAKGRHFRRYGIVSSTPVAEDDLPPGIRRMLDYMGKPWGKLDDAFSLQVTARLGKGANFYDRCVHTILRSDDSQDLMTVMFDYQRTYNEGQPITTTALKETAASTERAALKYFEEIAEGDRFDEVNIRDEVNA